MSVIKISEATSIAVHTLILLAMNKERLRSSKEIAAILGVSEGHLCKVLQILGKAGYIDSTRGPKGGFWINKDDKEIKLIDVYNLIEGLPKQRKCTFNAVICSNSCILDSLTESLTEKFLELFESITISDILSMNIC